LTERQLALLRAVVASNGGGVSCAVDPERTVMRQLERRGLVQGKAGEQWRAVHTKEGLAVVRETAGG
jgi:uncharacterized protein YjhX (UPF0386 family)